MRVADKARLFVVAVPLIVWNICCASAADTAELQAFAGRVKAAYEQAIDGQQLSPDAVRSLEEQARRFGPTAAADAVFDRKLRSVRNLLGALQQTEGGTPLSVENRFVQARASIDVEVVTATHGGRCVDALGIAAGMPVRFTLAAAGEPGSDAWLRFQPGAPFARFATDSTGADPALEVSDGCGKEASTLAANDDGFGLDASVTLAMHGRAPVFVHVSNTGAGGSVIVAATQTSASVSGKVTDAISGLPIQSANVTLLTANGIFTGSTNTDANGNYTIAPYSIYGGLVYVRVDASSHISQLYPSAPCAYGSYWNDISKCAIAQAQGIALADGDIVTGIDVPLGRGQTLSGVVQASTGEPILAMVDLYADGGGQLGSMGSDENGVYAFHNVPPGAYELVGRAGAYGSQVFDHVTCGGPLLTNCDLAQGTTVQVASQDVGSVDFSLPLMATIKGSVAGSDSQPLPGYSVQLIVLDAYGNQVAYAGTDAFGRYSAGPLGIGTYYIYASANGYFSQIFNGIDCAASCFASAASATAITISALGQVATASFRMHALPIVRGHVQDATTGYPLANVRILATTSPNAPYYNTPPTTDADGSYTLPFLAPGQYYVWAQSDDHVDQIAPNIDCELYAFNYQQTYNCNLASAALLTIAPGQIPPDFDFALKRSASISGRATILAGMSTNLPASVVVSIYNTSGQPVAGAYTDASGSYVVNDLGPGTYYATTSSGWNSGSYIPQNWQFLNCSGTCLPLTGTAIVAGEGQAVAAINFVLTRTDAIVGRVIDKNGAPLPQAYVDLFAAEDSRYVGSGVADDDGYFAAQAPTGAAYYVGTDAPGHLNQVYTGIACPLGPAFLHQCPLAGATPVNVSGVNTLPVVVNFKLQDAEYIFDNGFE